MLVIRMQRTGRKGHAQFRVVVQDSRRTPTSGKIVASLGSFNPHSKQTIIDKEKAQFYLEHGAQPSERVVRLLQAEGVKLPKWVKGATKKESTVRNPEKRRSTRPAEPEAPAEQAAPAAEEASIEKAEPTVAETADETPAEKVDEVATEVAVEEVMNEPIESTEQIAQTEEAAADTAAKADETDVTDTNQNASTEPPAEA